MISMRWMLVFPLLAACALGCNGPSEGERCNPNRSSSECADDLQCVVPASCAIAVCCSDKSTHPACQPCPLQDGGADGGT